MPKKNDCIRVYGAREHNLKNVSVDIPKQSLTVITGPSGSGKSSLALGILYTEGKRRYVESLSSYARQFLGIAKKPEFDRIEGLCPSVAIDQKTIGSNPRSTVGTVTEIYDYMRVLFARIGVPHCPRCKVPIEQQEPDVITRLVIRRFTGKQVTIAAPMAEDKKGEFTNDLIRLHQAGLYRHIIDGKKYRFASEEEIKKLKLKKSVRHTIDTLIDKIKVVPDNASRLQEAIELAFSNASGTCKIIANDKKYIFSADQTCVGCSYSVGTIEPRLFSFNSPVGACQKCSGLGVVEQWGWNLEEDSEGFVDRFTQHVECSDCQGRRLNMGALNVTIQETNIWQVCQMSIPETKVFLESLQLLPKQADVAQAVLDEICSRLEFLVGVGLTYLTLNRTSRTLSGGEGQRIRLATQIGSALSGVLYVLDEPSIGLHQRDNARLINTLQFLRDQGNTVVVVEHDLETVQAADHVIDIGPGSGILGGEITAVGNPEQLKKDKKSLTGAYLSGKKCVAIPAKRRIPINIMRFSNVTKHNLEKVAVNIPLGVMCGVSGVSGSGKSTLIMHSLVPALNKILRRIPGTRKHGLLSGHGALRHLVVIDQSPIGRTPRSNPATYLGIFDLVRKLYASLPESNARGYTPGRFSFNVAQGRCSECRGDGTITVSMHFLPDVTMQCKECNGSRYDAQTLEITFKEKNIAQVLDMTVLEATSFFDAHSVIKKRLDLLCSVGLDYLKLGQPSTTLSGGEAQRIKLVNELAKRGTETLYVLDEPTTGLHNSDIEKLLNVLNRLVNKGNSMIIIEHNLDVLKTMDHIIDLGPEGGTGGGQIVAQGTPEEVAATKGSFTGAYLAKEL